MSGASPGTPGAGPRAATAPFRTGSREAQHVPAQAANRPRASTASAIVAGASGTKGTTSTTPILGCTPEWYRRSSRSTARSATGLACRIREPFGGGSEDAPLVAWLQTIWPGDRRAWFAASAGALLDNIDWEQAAWENRGRLEPLFEPWTPVGREGAWLLAVALQAKEPGERGLAVDAFAAALDEGRLAPAALVTAMGELSSALEDQPASTYPITLFRPARLAASLREVASRSTANATAAHLVAGGALSAIVRVERPEPVPPAQLPPLLRLVVELSAELGGASGRTGTPRS